MKTFKLNKKQWKIRYDPTMQGAQINCGKGEYDGVCLPATRELVIDPNGKEIDLTVKHELVHAILYTMEHELAEDETFVNSFSELLHEAETTMKTNYKYVKFCNIGFTATKTNLKLFQVR